MKRGLILVVSIIVLQLTGCKSIVKDYTTSELDVLKVTMQGSGYMRGGKFWEQSEEIVWTCFEGAPRVSVDVANRTAKTKLEFYGRYFRKEGQVTDQGTVLVTNSFFKHNLNLKVDLKRQQAKVSISKKIGVNNGCQSKWFDLEIVES